ncbi:hypothetical protein [Nocardioides sp. AE5]|uniref:sunset domain-containing protein n=1 Tax=Nocardioides sp. AE5 TaxID=2962573 RepID=UPI0028822B8A|nr:hypothetical protein [Nocardioides sp. AE5]MDT0202392.1 hypothetical protein [Nocardioides sp. AE5]
MGIRKKKTLSDQATEFAEGILPAIGSAMETAREHAVPLIEEAREKAGPMIAEGRQIAAEKAAEAREKAAPIIAEGRQVAAEKVAEAREKAAPLIAEGRQVAAEKVAEAREKAGPIIAEGRERAAEAAAEGKVAAAAKLNELRGIEPEPEKKGGKLKKFLLIGAVAGVAGVVVKKLTSGGSGDNWQSTYVPAPPPAPRAEATERANDDAAAATPDEALADAAEAPVATTTPDAPAEVVQLADGQDGNEADAPYGPGSAAPLADGSAPDASYVVKGNGDSMLFHTTESPSFERTKAEVWFTDVDAAQAAGFKPWNHKTLNS